MPMASTLLPEFDHEIAITRRVLQRIPAEHFAWRPHARSFTMGELGTHLANLLSWAGMALAEDRYDIAPPGQPRPTSPRAAGPDEMLAMFETNAAAARQAIAEAGDDVLLGTWTLLAGGHEVFTMPRVAVLRSFVVNHLIHHRGQLTVYLRLCDQPVPAVYGPSADEQPSA